jgi:hypothetical protein
MFTSTPDKETILKETSRTARSARRRGPIKRVSREPLRPFPFDLETSGGSIFGEVPSVTSSSTASPSTAELAGASLFPALPSAPTRRAKGRAKAKAKGPSLTSILGEARNSVEKQPGE